MDLDRKVAVVGRRSAQLEYFNIVDLYSLSNNRLHRKEQPIIKLNHCDLSKTMENKIKANIEYTPVLSFK
jgi:hypothetical protein